MAVPDLSDVTRAAGELRNKMPRFPPWITVAGVGCLTIVLAMVAAGFIYTYFSLSAPRLGNQPEEVAQAFLSDLKKEDFLAAYLNLSHRAQGLAGGAHSFQSSFSGVRITGFSLSKGATGPRTAHIVAAVGLSDPEWRRSSQVRFVFRLENTALGWRVDEISPSWPKAVPAAGN